MTQHPSSGPFNLGWREWLALPALGIPAIKAKIDTGARTSALHAFELETYEEKGVEMVRFGIHPLQRRSDITVFCNAVVADKRIVRDSGGHLEARYVIHTPIRMAEREWPVEITLTNREDMIFRMLLGRTAIRPGMLVDPLHSYLLGRRLRHRYRSGRRP